MFLDVFKVEKVGRPKLISAGLYMDGEIGREPHILDSGYSEEDSRRFELVQNNAVQISWLRIDQVLYLNFPESMIQKMRVKDVLKLKTHQLTRIS